MRRVVKWFDEHFEETLLIILLVAICTVMMTQVVMRKFFNNSLSWPEEFCRYCYVWTTFLTLTFSVRAGNILRVEVLVDLFPPVIRKLVYLLGNVAMLIFFAVFFYQSINVVKGIALSGQTSTAMGLPMYMVYFSTTLGFGLGTIRTVQVILRQIVNFRVPVQAAVPAIKKEAAEEVAQAKAELEKFAAKGRK